VTDGNHSRSCCWRRASSPPVVALRLARTPDIAFAITAGAIPRQRMNHPFVIVDAMATGNAALSFYELSTRRMNAARRLPMNNIGS
jgi:hypothetical protein